MHICPHHHVVVLNLRVRRSCHNANENLRNYGAFLVGRRTRNKNSHRIDSPSTKAHQKGNRVSATTTPPLLPTSHFGNSGRSQSTRTTDRTTPPTPAPAPTTFNAQTNQSIFSTTSRCTEPPVHTGPNKTSRDYSETCSTAVAPCPGRALLRAPGVLVSIIFGV